MSGCFFATYDLFSQGINPELDTVVKALSDLGEERDRRGREGWLNVLTALMQVQSGQY